MAKHTVEKWIQEALTDTEKEGACTAMSLVHMIAGAGKQEIHTIKITAAKKWTAKDLHSVFRGKAEGFAAELPGVQTFALLAFYDNRSEPEAKKPFTIQGEQDFGGTGGTEGPNTAGMLAQGMRHSEAVIQMSFRQSAMLFEIMRGALQELGQTNRQLMVENRDAYTIVQKIMLEQGDRRHVHNLELLEKQNAQQQKKMLMALAPPLINTLTGKEVFPQATSDTALLDAIGDRLDETTVRQLAASGVIPQDIMGLLMARFGERLKKKREAQVEASDIIREEGGVSEVDEEDEAAE